MYSDVSLEDVQDLNHKVSLATQATHFVIFTSGRTRWGLLHFRFFGIFIYYWCSAKEEIVWRKHESWILQWLVDFAIGCARCERRKIVRENETHARSERLHKMHKCMNRNGANVVAEIACSTHHLWNKLFFFLCFKVDFLHYRLSETVDSRVFYWDCIYAHKTARCISFSYYSFWSYTTLVKRIIVITSRKQIVPLARSLFHSSLPQFYFSYLAVSFWHTSCVGRCVVCCLLFYYRLRRTDYEFNSFHYFIFFVHSVCLCVSRCQWKRVARTPGSENYYIRNAVCWDTHTHTQNHFIESFIARFSVSFVRV